MRMYFDRDNDGHWYIIPLKERKKFCKALNNIYLSEYYSDEYQDNSEKFEEEFGKYRATLSPNSYSFENLEEIKND